MLRASIGVGVGLVMALVAIVAAGAREAEPISLAWPQLAYEIGHGRNTVNVALVDLRGWDTMGELAVVIAAATGVASLLFLRGRGESPPRIGRTAVKRRISARLDRIREQGSTARCATRGFLRAPHSTRSTARFCSKWSCD
jgi:multicomponent Na+:H+ antiporter subunit A